MATESTATNASAPVPRRGEITLAEGVGKNSGKPYTALRLTVGRWSQLYFVNSKFELEYLIKQLKDNNVVGTISLVKGKDGRDSLSLVVGEWSELYRPDSAFELKYVVKALSAPAPAPATSTDDFQVGGRTILDDDASIANGLFD